MMKNKLKTILLGIKSSEIGSLAVEYALLLPVFMTLIFGSVEMGRVFMVYSALEGAVTESTRIAITGNVPAGFATSDAYIKDYVQTALTSIAKDSVVSINMSIYDSFANIGQPEPFTGTNGNTTYDIGECYTDINNNAAWDADMGAAGTGAGENIMVMNVSVDLPYISGNILKNITGKNSIVLTSSTAVRNEPFGGVAWTPSANVICV